MYYQNFIKRLFVYLQPHLGKLLFTSAMMILATALETTLPELTGRIIDQLFLQDVPNRNTTEALFYALLVLGAIAFSAIFALTSTATSAWVSSKVIMDLRKTMFDKLLKLPKTYFDQHPTGKILSKLTFDVEQIASTASTIWLSFVKSSMMVILLIGYLFYKNWQLSLTLLILLPLVYMAVKHSSKRMRNASKHVQNSMGEMTHLLDENISGNSLVKIYHAQSQERNKFNTLVTNIRQQRFKVDMSSGFNTAFVNILIGASLGSVVYFSAINLAMSAGDFMAFFSAMAMLPKPAKSLININKPLQSAMTAGESVFGLIDENEEFNQGVKTLTQAKGEIRLQNVCFGYTSDKAVLNNINLHIRPGESVAFVGATGSGKTTIIQLLMRFYLPNSGTISIDGVDINEFRLDSLHAQIAFVDQHVRLFNDSIKNNIALGQTDKITDMQIKQAAELSNAIAFIEKMHKKFDTQIGENGTKLSGGQRQRLAIARAIAKDVPILILDEATSALDSATEKHVQTAINKMQKNRTTLMIAHRFSTIQKADRIVVLSQGSIVEQGTHQSLLAQDGEYASLYKHQFIQ